MIANFKDILREELLKEELTLESFDQQMIKTFSKATEIYTLKVCREFLEAMINNNVVLSEATKEEIDAVFRTE